MATAIGIRVYLISLRNKADTRKPLVFADKQVMTPGPKFITQFVSAHASPTQSVERERTWYFEEKEQTGSGNSKGYVHYGTFGFESNFIDSKTKKRNYRRKVTDVEEIPLFYEFWCPPNSPHAFAAFQSFQGRSCITLVMNSMQEIFEHENPGFRMAYKKLMPGDVAASRFYSAPVKNFRLVKKHASADLAEQYLPHRPSTPIDFEVAIRARRRSNLGLLSTFATGLPKDLSRHLVTHAGLSFDEAVAEILVGGRLRKVGVFGINSDAGAIDLSDVVKLGPDGHPIFESIRKESDALLKDFHKTILKMSDP